SLIDLCLIEQVDPNGRDTHGRTPFLIRPSRQDWKTARRLIDASALVEHADEKGFTPLMAAAMHGNLEMFRAFLARLTNLHAEARCKDGRDLLGMALDGGNPEIIRTVTERLPLMPQWRTSTRRALEAALLAGNKDQIRLLLGPTAPVLQDTTKCLRYTLPPRRASGGARKSFSAAALRQMSCASKFPSLRNAWLLSRTACRCSAPNARLAGEVTPHGAVSL